MKPISGVAQHYPWGTYEAIPRFLGLEPDGKPWAEYWLGTHPNGPATTEDGSPLSSLTGELSYLLKLLSAQQPLSLQTHPNRKQAQQGFGLGKFADPNPKPELLCAITEFTALCGFRPIADSVVLLTELGLDNVAQQLVEEGLRHLVTGLYHRIIDSQPIVSACEKSDLREAQLITKLHAMHPDDPSVAVSLLLNLVTLQPGQALRLDAGNLHAYVSGTGIELMAASDNVVRGGLTNKPVDVDLLLEIIDTNALHDPVLPAGQSYELTDVGITLRRVNIGDEVVTDIYSLSIRDDGVCCYTPPGETIDSRVGSWVVVSAQ